MVITGCGDASEELTERIIESQEGVGNVEIDEDGESVTIEIENEDGGGSINIGGGGSLPDGFPIPVPDGGEVVASFSGEGDEGTSYNAVLLYPADAFDEMKAFYQDWYDGAGLESGSSSDGEIEGNRFFNINGQDASGGFVSIGGSETDEGVSLTIITGS